MSALPESFIASAANDASDADTQETREWLEALAAVIDSEGPQRAHFLLERLIDEARQAGIDTPFSATTPYVNHRGGARGPLSILFSCGAVLVGLLALPPVIALLRRTVIARVLAAVAIQAVDLRTLKLLGSLLLPRRRFSQSMGVDLAVICAPRPSPSP